MRILLITNLYPNSIERNRGIFIKQAVDALVCTNKLRVIAPVAWFPRFCAKFRSRLLIKKFLMKRL
jgi:hypothetical protein